MAMKSAPVVEAWRKKGSVCSVDGLNTYVWSEGEGDPVVYIHGVPASAYCYRKRGLLLSTSCKRIATARLPQLLRVRHHAKNSKSHYIPQHQKS
jgi:pimeloyl-ACP methyl ester carboxylesterase